MVISFCPDRNQTGAPGVGHGDGGPREEDDGSLPKDCGDQVLGVVGTNNEIITSSIDRCIKIWNLDYIFEKERHIDKHELTIDALSISTTAGIAVTVTRSCLGKFCDV